MKTFTLILFSILMVSAHTLFAQKVVVIGLNHNSTSPNTDGFSFVAVENLTAGEIIYFTENEYSDAGNAFVNLEESVVKFTVTSAINTGNVVFVNETGTSTNAFTVSTSSGAGTAVKTVTSGSFSIATDGESFYAYADTDEDPTNGVTEIYAAMCTGSGEIPAAIGGDIPSDLNPLNDFPNAVVVDGFSYVATPDRVEYKTSVADRTNVNQTMLENPGNYATGAPAALSTQAFTNFSLSGSNPVLTISASTSSIVENSGSTVTFTFTLSSTAGSNITANFSVGGTAVFNSDYTQSGATSFSASAGTIVIPSGMNSASFTISASGDTDLEPDETVLLQLTAGTGYDAGSPSTTNFTIINDDSQSVTPLVAITGTNQNDPEGFSFVALDDITPGTTIYFTENAFSNSTLAFGGTEGVLSWTSPPADVLRGEVIVVKENPANVFTASSQSGNAGTVALVSGTLSLASSGEGFYAYTDTDNNPLNGVSEVHAVLYTGSSTSGGNIPLAEDPSSVYSGAIVVDGFAAVAPDRTEYDPAKRNVTVDNASFQNVSNWLHAQANQDLSTVPFSNIIITSGSANPIVTLSVSPANVLEDSGDSLFYTFNLNTAASGDITINFDVAGSADFSTDYTVSGSASFGSTSGTIVIADGISSAVLAVVPLADTDLEIQENVQITLSSGTGYDAGSPNDASGTISNDDTSTSDPLVAITGLNHESPDGFSFVAIQTIPASTTIYFTDKSYDNTTLTFSADEAVLTWTSPASEVPTGQVFVVTETSADVFAIARSSASAETGSITLISGNFALATNGESFYAYTDDDTDPTNGVVDIYSVLFTGTALISGGAIPASEDPSGIYTQALVVEGFTAAAPDRTEYDPAKRNVSVEQVDFENSGNWLHAQANQVLSDVPFTMLKIGDIIPPTAVCKDLSVSLDAAGTASISALDVDGGSSDNIGIVSYTIDISSFTCADIGNPVTVTLTVADASGNTDNCTATITVLDEKAPSPICINGLSVHLDDTGNFTLQPEDLLASPLSDNCSAVSLTLSNANYTCADLGINMVQLHATDVYGNSDYCETFIIVNDVTPPTAICQNIDVYLDGAGNANIVAADLDGGSTDNCGSVSFSASATAFTCADIGPNNVLLSVTDQSSNSASCNAIVNVIDTVSPLAICKNITVYLDATGTANILASDIDAGSVDNCGGITLSASATTFTCSDLGDNIVTLTVSDQSANTSTCEAVVTVLDPLPPAIFCPGNQLEVADANCTFTLPDYTGLASASDNCNIVQMQQEPAAGTVISGTTTVTLTTDDGNGNLARCSFDVSVIDVSPPIAICKDISVYLDGSGNATITAADIDGGSSDNCTRISLNASQTAFTCADIGPNNVTLTVTDENGFSGSCVAIVTVLDTTAPDILCKDVTIYLDAAGEAPYTDFINAGAIISRSDNCGLTGLGISGPRTYTCDQVGDNTVNLYQNDVSGNQSVCTFTLTVLDTTTPVAMCKDITVYLDEKGQSAITAADLDNGSTDNCLDSMWLSKTDFDCSVLGENTVKLYVSDASGNIDSCAAKVTVADTISPSVVCKNIFVQLDQNGMAGITEDQIDGGSTDNCGIDKMWLSKTDFTCADMGDNEVILYISDASNNVDSCKAVVSVEDIIAPLVVCTNITVQLDQNGAATITASQLDGGSSDNCMIDKMWIQHTDFTCDNLGPNSIYLYVADASGNIDSCEAIVTVEDTIAPLVLCSAITLELDQNGMATIVASQLDKGSSDNCAIDKMWLSQTDFSCSESGNNSVLLYVSDVSGNIDSCEATITIVDVTDPIAVCKNITIQLDQNGQAEITAMQLDGGSSDNCGIVKMWLDRYNFSEVDLGNHSVTLFVEDASGNSSSCVASVTVADTEPPVVLCNSIGIYLDENGEYSFSAEEIKILSAGTTDNQTAVQDLEISAVLLPKTVSCSGGSLFVRVDVTATDKSNNSATCSVWVEVMNDLELVNTELEDIELTAPFGECETQIAYPEFSTLSKCAKFIQISGIGPEGFFPVGTSEEVWAIYNARGDTLLFSFNVTVISENQAPTLDALAAIDTSGHLASISVPLTGISAGNDCIEQDIAVSASGVNEDLISSVEVNYTSNDSTGILVLYIAPSASGSDTITVLVEDSEGASVSKSFVIKVNYTNEAPEVVNPVPDQEVNANRELVIPLIPGEIFNDPEADSLIVEISNGNGGNLPSWITYENDSLYARPAIDDTGCVSVIVHVSDPAGATAADTFLICAQGFAVGVTELVTNTLNLGMYPNPSRGMVNLEFDTPIQGETELLISDITGKQIAHQKYHSQQLIQLDLSDQVSGVYLIKVYTNGKYFTQKLILNKR